MPDTGSSGFGHALDILKAGGKVRPAGWNGKGMWLGLQQPHVEAKMTRRTSTC